MDRDAALVEVLAPGRQIGAFHGKGQVSGAGRAVSWHAAVIVPRLTSIEDDHDAVAAAESDTAVGKVRRHFQAQHPRVEISDRRKVVGVQARFKDAIHPHMTDDMRESLTPAVRDLLALNLVPGLGPRLTAALLKHFGSAAAVRAATLEQLRSAPRIGAKLSADFAAALAAVNVDAECELIERHGVRLLPLGEPGYPERLAEIAGPPHILYTRGSISPADRRAVAIVGSRGCTTYGRRITEQLAVGLSRAGYTIVSGLARGIDAVAHAAAIKAGGRTMAVLAGGLSRIYPPEHAELATAIEHAGALMSEAPMAAEPLPQMFPSRNRIISGLSLAVIVTEASDRSGSLITARHAADQGRDVLVVPGPVDSPASAGCLRLIRAGATMIRNLEDALEVLERHEPPLESEAPTEAHEVPGSIAAPPADLDETARRIWDLLAGGEQPVDRLAQELGIGMPELTQSLMRLEMRRVIRRLPGNRYERV